MGQVHTYARFCSIVRSSGMGKSRLLDEFSKSHFLIPINLRPKDTHGFPPPDVAVRDFLTKYDRNDPEIRQKSHPRLCHFLFSLFDCTKDLIVTLGADNKEERIVTFREFMLKGQTFVSTGKNRLDFYEDVVKQAQKDLDDQLETPSNKKLRGTFERLQECVYDTPLKGKQLMADVFIAFDEARPLTDHRNQAGGLSNYTELRRALQVLSISHYSRSSFLLLAKFRNFRCHVPTTLPIASTKAHSNHLRVFLSLSLALTNSCRIARFLTNTKHSDKSLPRNASRTWEGRCGVQCMISATCKSAIGCSFSRFKTYSKVQQSHLSQRTSSMPFCRSVWPWTSTSRHTSRHPRLMLLKKILKQIENHMRVCVEIKDGMEIIRGVSASEPILSEVASYIMGQNFLNSDLAGSPSNVLSGFSINLGDRGELLVAAFFTWARDHAVVKQPPLPLPEFCRHFLVEELFSCLFFKPIVKSMFKQKPSIGPSNAEKRTLREKELVTHRYLIAAMARGAAVLGTNCQAGVDMVFPYLYCSTDLDDNNVGFTMVQVENDRKFSLPDADLFRKMDPFHCGLLDKSDHNVSCIPFSIPIIRIVFALRGNESKVTHMRYSSPSEGALPAGLDDCGETCFTSYDYWCSGIGPNLLQLIGTATAHEKWNGLLEKTDSRFLQVHATNPTWTVGCQTAGFLGVLEL